MERTRVYRVRHDMRRCYLGVLLMIIVLFFNSVWSSSAQTVTNKGLCSTVERSVVTYSEAYQVTRSYRATVKCGFLNWNRCTQYRVAYTSETRVAYRDTYNIVFNCCRGWVLEPDGSCLQNTIEETPSQSEPTDALTPSIGNDTTSTLIPKSLSPSPSTSSSGSPPGEIANPDAPKPIGTGDTSDGVSSDQEHIGMIGGVVGVAVALLVMVSLMIFFVSRRKRRARDKRKNSDPGVVFELLNSSSSPQGPIPDIYTEIPDRDTNIPDSDTNANTAASLPETGRKDNSDEYDIAFRHSQQPSGPANTYQDVSEASGRRDGCRESKEESEGSPVMKKVDMEVHLGQNGAVYSKTRDKGEMGAGVGSPYQNLPGLDVTVQPPDIYDTVGTKGINGAYNKLDRANSKPVIPTDPDDEAYNMIIIGPNEEGNKRYDRLDRQRGGSNICTDGQLDTPIPAAPGYSALGLDNHLGYDKLTRHETHGVDTERKNTTIGPNTYSELEAQGRKSDYDKLVRRRSDDHGLNDPIPAPGAHTVVPNGNLVANKYDTINVAKPADGEIYENLPKKPIQNGQVVKMPPKDSGDCKQDLNRNNSPPTSPPTVHPVYDVIPGSPRMLNSPVYDMLPKSPCQRDGAPVYDTPPASLNTTPQVCCEDQLSPVVRGPRPVYDTPPVRAGNTCPLQFQETCPVYENTPTAH